MSDGFPTCDAKRRAPASPSCPPSTDASTSVFCDARPSNTRANSISAAVSAALPASSGTVAAAGAAGRVGHGGRVARGEHDDLLVGRARPAAHDVHEPRAVLVEAIERRAEAV